MENILEGSPQGEREDQMLGLAAEVWSWGVVYFGGAPVHTGSHQPSLCAVTLNISTFGDRKEVAFVRNSCSFREKYTVYIMSQNITFISQVTDVFIESVKPVK